MRGLFWVLSVGGAFAATAHGCGSHEASNTPPPGAVFAEAGTDASASNPGCGTIDARTVRPDKGFAYLVRYFAASGDTDAETTRSSVVVYEDGRPLATAHAPTQDVQTFGAGRYRHHRHTLSFSASDNSDPRTNGRTYTWSVPKGACPVSICGRIDTSTAVTETGLNHIVEKSFGFRGDTSASPSQSGLVLYEDDTQLGPPHTLHADIRTRGHGRFSHWGNSLYFSSSDGSSPKENGREYVYGGPCRRLARVEMTKLADNAPLYATFQSHNQKVVENAHGIFLTYLDQATPSGLGEGYGDRHHWQLARSTDGGRTFQTLYAESMVGKAPVLETDEAGDVYLITAGVATTPGGRFFRFSAANDFATPTPVAFAGGDAGKYAATYDATRKVFHYFTFVGSSVNFFTLDKAGNVTRKFQLVTNGPVGVLQYPHLAMRGSTLFAAWTTQKFDVYLYWDIHFAKSEDGGQTWQKLDGTPLALPIVADDSGPADGVVLPDELGAHNWLSSFYPKGDAVHFMYESQLPNPNGRQHHVRWGGTPPSVTRNRYPVWAGGELAIHSLDGFFASTDDGPDSLLYAISTHQTARVGEWPAQSLVVLASDDNGATWFDYALGPQMMNPYSIGGARRVSGGYIDGTLTDLLHQDASNPNGHAAWFFRIQAE